MQAFDAIIASDRSDAEARLGARYGSALAADLEVVKGFDPSLPLVEALLSPAMIDLLKRWRLTRLRRWRTAFPCRCNSDSLYEQGYRQMSADVEASADLVCGHEN
ncbi:hypothetical protein [Sphingomonas faeni]|uniref:hypothetical protein n=1 Tax=Sphingomonas faeni TaxID=185950 RepID=UPI0033650ADA